MFFFRAVCCLSFFVPSQTFDGSCGRNVLTLKKYEAANQQVRWQQQQQQQQQHRVPCARARSSMSAERCRAAGPREQRVGDRGEPCIARRERGLQLRCRDAGLPQGASAMRVSESSHTAAMQVPS